MEQVKTRSVEPHQRLPFLKFLGTNSMSRVRTCSSLLKKRRFSRQEALQTIFPLRLNIFYHPNFRFLQKKRVFQQPQDFSTSI